MDRAHSSALGWRAFGNDQKVIEAIGEEEVVIDPR
jgi:hypothetical protein